MKGRVDHLAIDLCSLIVLISGKKHLHKVQELSWFNIPMLRVCWIKGFLNNCIETTVWPLQDITVKIWICLCIEVVDHEVFWLDMLPRWI